MSSYGNKMKYNIQCSREQVQLINNALDLYSRVLIGQLQEVESVLRWNIPENDDPNRYEKLNKLSDAIKEAKPLIGLPQNGSYGIHNTTEVSDVARKMWDMQKVFRHKIAWDDEGKDPNIDERDFKRMFGVNFDTPDKSSTDENFELPTIDKVK